MSVTTQLTPKDLESMLLFTIGLARKAGDLIREGSAAIQSAPSQSGIGEKVNSVPPISRLQPLSADQTAPRLCIILIYASLWLDIALLNMPMGLDPAQTLWKNRLCLHRHLILSITSDLSFFRYGFPIYLPIHTPNLESQVEDTIFKVPIHCFEVSGTPFETMFSLPKSDNGQPEGSDKNPIILQVDVNFFRGFLGALYPSQYLAFIPNLSATDHISSSQHKMTNEDWLGALELATMWMFEEVGRSSTCSC